MQRQFAGGVTWQLLDQQQRPWQEYRIDAGAQGPDDVCGIELWGHDQRGEPRDAGERGFRIVAHEERAVDDARNRVELVIEIGERAALAGDVDQIGRTPMQQEMLLANRLEHIGQCDRPLDVTALRRALALANRELHARP